MTPRQCQYAAREAALVSIANGSPDVIEMITGSGKSIAVAMVLRAVNLDNVVVVTSRTDLVGALAYTFWRLLDPAAQAFDAVSKDRLSVEVRAAFKASAVVGRYDGHIKRLGQITVTTYPSLARCIEAMGGADKVRLLMCDEAHRSRGPKIRKVVQSISPRIGWTATPYPGDIKGRLPGWARVVYQYGAEQAIADGVIVPFERRLAMEGDAALAGADLAIDAAIRMVLREGDIGPGLVTAPNLATAQAWAARMTAAGVPAVAAVRRSKLYPEGLTPRELRRAYRATRRGEVRALITVDLLAEGVDLPWLRWVALCARPRDRIHLVQVIGRVLRTCAPDQWGAKARAIVFDPCRILDTWKLTHTAALGEDGRTAKPLTERQKVELARAKVVRGALTQFVTVLDVWAAGLLAQTRAWSIEGKDKLSRARYVEAMESRHEGERRIGPMGKPTMRNAPASAEEIGRLRRLSPMIQYVGGDSGEGHREQMRALIEAGRMTAGVCHDLWWVLTYIVGRRTYLKKNYPSVVLYKQGFVKVEGLGLPAAATQGG